MTLLYSIAVLGSLGVIAGIILAISFSRLKVKDDPLVEEIVRALPDINCGACGYASCHAYAELVAKGEAPADMCAPGGRDTTEKITAITGKEASKEKKKVRKIIVRCHPRERRFSSVYNGLKSCSAANISGGGMDCRFGCLGYGDCIKACPSGGIKINEAGVAEVVPGRCTGCGLCVKKCPRNIIKTKTYSGGRAVYVGCSNTQEGKNARKVCSNACIACGLCLKRSPEGAFLLDNNLARVKRQDRDIKLEDIKCPTGCIYESFEQSES